MNAKLIDKMDFFLPEYEVVSTSKGPNGEEVSVLTTNQTHTAVENLKPESRYVATKDIRPSTISIHYDKYILWIYLLTMMCVVVRSHKCSIQLTLIILCSVLALICLFGKLKGAGKSENVLVFLA